MFTAELVTSLVDKEKRRRIVKVRFFDGTTDFRKDFEFSVETEVPKMKKTVKNFLDELNFVPEEITGDITEYTEPVEDTPTAEELEKKGWEEDKSKLAQLQELIDMGVFTGTETPIIKLRNKVKAGFKPEYIN